VTDERVKRVSEDLHDGLEAEGIDVLLDDRNARPGVKFKDADLLGIPIRVTVGPKGLGQDAVEVKLRRDRESEAVPVDQARRRVKELVTKLHDQLTA